MSEHERREHLEAARLVKTVSDIALSGQRVEIKSGIITKTPDPQTNPAPYTWQLKVDGVVVTPIWGEGVIPWHGAQCTVALAHFGDASKYFVVSIASSRPSLSGFAIIASYTGGAPTCVVTIDGINYTAQVPDAYTPTAGQGCLVLDVGERIVAIGSLRGWAMPPRAMAPPVPAPPIITGAVSNSVVTAQDSGTWTATLGGWNTYFRQDVFSGSGYVPVSTGSWFYNGGSLGLATRTINALRFWLPPRIQRGAYQVPAVIHLYAHTSISRGSTEPARTVGPYDYTVPAYWPGGWITLPGSFATPIQAGGGISIAGDPYVGFVGVATNGYSGALSADWSA